ncbi:hypothetical protein ACGFIF_31185 [Kribbella sp. NPDC049174]|uniref:hypothetical protein n=1 Tax=Kribbella sp. NPDC049174 TaxID=3364112 RepID=UPI00371DD5E8
MTRMIERWFPCAEVSLAAASGWGSGNVERKLFTWFAARPSAQAKAAVVCSLLPWPDEEAEQKRLQTLVREAMTGRDAAWTALRHEIMLSNTAPVRVLDPFSGRGIIPLEAARLGLPAAAIDYSPVAVLATSLLAEHPFIDWTNEPPLPFSSSDKFAGIGDRLVEDVDLLLAEIGRRHQASMRELFPANADGSQPWGYLWAVTLPCQECGRRFPLVGKNLLREPSTRRVKGSKTSVVDPGQSFFVRASRTGDTFEIVPEDGPPRHPATLVNARGTDGKKIPGKAAVCVFCSHAHPLNVHRRLTNEGEGKDALLLVADHDPTVGKRFRLPTDDEIAAAQAASEALGSEKNFGTFLPAIPDEVIGPGNNNIIGPSIYGARTFGDFMCDRQTLFYVRLCRVIDEIGLELAAAGISDRYARALTGYAAANMVRMLRYSTRGAWLHTAGTPRIAGIFLNEGSLSFSYDFFEAGIGDGPGTWEGVRGSSVSTLRDLMPSRPGTGVEIRRASATELPFGKERFAAVVTDPPYDEMIAYADSSDIFFAWLRRALVNTWPELAVSAEPGGAQEKALEIIVKRSRGLSKSEFKEHRTREHYDTLIAQAFTEMRRVVQRDGVVTIVFGHGDPEVWQRLLASIDQAGLIMTGSWPANTESGGRQNKANIQTTLTMCCRPASEKRQPGRKGSVEREIRDEIRKRYLDWERWGLAPADMLMAAVGPAMEVVGRYESVLDAKGEAVDIYTFLPLARAAVQDAMAVEVDHHPLETFDARTRFALWWVRLYGREVQAKSELRWQSLASSLDIAEVRDLVPEAGKGVAFTTSRQFKGIITADSSVIDVALALAAASDDGLSVMGEILVASKRSADDTYLWAAIKFLADRLPDSDADSIFFNRVLRTRSGITSAAEAVSASGEQERRRQVNDDAQLRLL